MSLIHIGSFQVSQTISNQFAEASGDFNPLHVNPVSARRYQFGSTVIHGVCGFFNAIDQLLAQYGHRKSIASVNVQFNRPVLHGKKVDIYRSDVAENKVKLELSIQGKRVQVINLEFAEGVGSTPTMVERLVNHDTDSLEPVNLIFSEVISLDTSFDLIWAPALIQSLFPNIKQYLPDNQTAVLLGLTNIVGMQCPGIDSVFAGFSLNFMQEVSVCDEEMRFNISKHDDRFSLITISISHNTANGEIEALFRPKPIQQPSFSDLTGIVPDAIFAEQRALIIGGSRGIGEVTAKLIAAGGGHPVITYAQGRDDAENIAQDIQSNGGKCNTFSFNVLQKNNDIVNCFNGESVTHIYYFASPLIEKSDEPIWDDAIFQKLYAFYLTGLTDLIGLFLPVSEYRKSGITIFIPSTIFLQEPQQGFSEYIAAKATVEAFAKQFSARYKNWEFITPRLPRMMTDQTSGVAKDPPMKAAEILLEALLAMVTKAD